MPVMKFLIENGIDPTILSEKPGPNGKMQPEEHMACIIREVAADHPDMGHFLLERMDVNAITADNACDMHDLMTLAVAVGSEDLLEKALNAAHSDDQLRKLLLAHGLFSAARYGHAPMVNLLLDRGASPSGKYPPGYSGGHFLPIVLAIESGHVEIVRALLDTEVGLSLQQRLSILDPALDTDPSDAHDQILHLLLDQDSISDFSHLEPAARDDCVRDLLENAVDRDPKSFDLLCRHFQVALDRDNSLHQSAFVEAARRAELTFLRQFLEAGFDPNFIGGPDSEHRNLVLLLATATAPDRKHAEAGVQLLLQFGANINVRDPLRNNMTALNMTASNISVCGQKIKPGTDIQVIKLLLKNGADLLATDSHGNDVLFICANKGRTIPSKVPTVKALLECFDEQSIPFERIKGKVAKAAAAAADYEVGRTLWNYYWRKVYPV